MAKSKSTHDVFLSFRHRDKPAAESIAEILRSYNLIVYVDEFGIGSGSKIEDEIWDAMAESRAFITIVPDDSTSASMAFELGAAKAWNKPIYAIASSSSVADLPLLRNVHVYPLSRIEEVAQSIVQASQAIPDEDKQHLADAYLKVGVSTDQLLLQPQSLAELVTQFRKRSRRQLSGEQLMEQLLRLRKQGTLPVLGKRPSRKTS